MVKSASMLSRVGVVGGVAVRRSGLRTVTTCVAVRGGGGGNPNAVAPPFYRLPDSKEPVRRVCVLVVVGCIPCRAGDGMPRCRAAVSHAVHPVAADSCTRSTSWCGTMALHQSLLLTSMHLT